MAFNKMTIGKKITLGFAIVLGLLAVAGVLSFTGVGQIVTNAQEVISGNQLDCALAQKEVDHLNWAGKVNALLTDDAVTELKVQTDPHKCAFGQWLYGQGRQQAEALVPSLAPLLKEIEDPHAQLHASAIAIKDSFQPADAALPGFLAEKYVDHLQWSAGICQLFLGNKDKLTAQTDPHKCAFGKWYYSEEAKKAVAGNPELAKLYAAIEEPHRKLHESAATVGSQYRQIHPGLLESLMARLDDHRRWAQKVSDGVLLNKADLGVQTDPTLCAFGKWLASDEAKAYMAAFPTLKEAVAEIQGPHDKLHESAKAISAALAIGDNASAREIFSQQTLPALNKVAAGFEKVVKAEQELVHAQGQAKTTYEQVTLPILAQTGGLLQKMRTQAEAALQGQNKARGIYANQTMPALAKTQELLGKLRQEARAHIMTDTVMLDSARGTRFEVSVVSGVAVLVGLLLSFFIVRGITAVLRRISAQMGEGAEQVAAAAGQVSAASQSLAQGASEQAASLEETSSSLEEMSSMTKQNADNAKQADSLMHEAGKVVGQATSSMKELKEAMTTITTASDETAKIIKTIDEIAFQTNLLALNAAVEAARAGEAGAGFAVVADEVRNLAMRAAEAAKNTQELIEGNLQNIKRGGDLVSATDEAFSQVEESSRKVGELVGEISAASDEQAQGIGQINKATDEMDKVTQQVAANAEESAASSEEMNAQAINLNDMVQELRAMVDGSGNGNGKKPRRIKARKSQPKALPAPSRGNDSHGRVARQVIPLEDDRDFADF